jgi:hypothetical protein
LQLEDKKFQGSETEHYYRSGFILAKLKFKYMNKCKKCESQSDMFVIVSCKGCVKASKVDTFFQDVKQLQLEKMEKTQSPDYINFFIRFSGLCAKDPSFRQITWNSTKLKKFMSPLVKQLKADKAI